MSEKTITKFLAAEKSLTVTPDAFTSGYYYTKDPGGEPTGYTSISAATAFTIAASNSGRNLIFVVQGNEPTFQETKTIGQSDDDIKTLAGSMWTGNTETNIEVTYQSADQTIDAVVAASTTPGMVLLATQTADNTPSLDFDQVFTSTYNSYMIKITNFQPATDASGIYLQMGIGGTPTYYAATQHANCTRYTNSAANTGVASSGGAASMLSTVDLGSDSGLGANGTLFLHNPAGAGSTYMHGTVVGYSSAWSGLVMHEVSGAEFQGTAVTSARLKFDSGNITVGTVEIYGYNKTV